MNTLIERYINSHPKAKEWSWFIILWFGGLSAALMLAYPIKFIIKSALV